MRERGTVFPVGAVDPLSLRPPIRTKPLVAAVQGICFTLGIELMLAADIVVAADDCRFAQIEVKRGIMPAGGATVRMVERAGWGNAQRYLLTGDEFGAAEALRLGFVQEVVPAGQQKERALELARRIAEQAPLAVRASLASSRIAVDHGPHAAIREFNAQQARLMATEDAAEGVRSFVERRTGRFGSGAERHAHPLHERRASGVRRPRQAAAQGRRASSSPATSRCWRPSIPAKTDASAQRRSRSARSGSSRRCSTTSTESST